MSIDSTTIDVGNHERLPQQAMHTSINYMNGSLSFDQSIDISNDYNDPKAIAQMKRFQQSLYRLQNVLGMSHLAPMKPQQLMSKAISTIKLQSMDIRSGLENNNNSMNQPMQMQTQMLNNYYHDQNNVCFDNVSTNAMLPNPGNQNILSHSESNTVSFTNDDNNNNNINFSNQNQYLLNNNNNIKSEFNDLKNENQSLLPTAPSMFDESIDFDNDFDNDFEPPMKKRRLLNDCEKTNSDPMWHEMISNNDNNTLEDHILFDIGFDNDNDTNEFDSQFNIDNDTLLATSSFMAN